MRYYETVNNGGLSISAARGRRKSEVISPFKSLTTVSLLVFNTHYVCKMHRLKVLGLPNLFDCQLWRNVDFDR
jgi:hypothetical protein